MDKYYSELLIELENNKTLLTEIMELLGGVWRIKWNNLSCFDGGASNVLVISIDPDIESYVTFYSYSCHIELTRSYNRALKSTIVEVLHYYNCRKVDSYLNNL